MKVGAVIPRPTMRTRRPASMRCHAGAIAASGGASGGTTTTSSAPLPIPGEPAIRVHASIVPRLFAVMGDAGARCVG